MVSLRQHPVALQNALCHWLKIREPVASWDRIQSDSKQPRFRAEESARRDYLRSPTAVHGPLEVFAESLDQIRDARPVEAEAASELEIQLL